MEEVVVAAAAAAEKTGAGDLYCGGIRERRAYICLTHASLSKGAAMKQYSQEESASPSWKR